MYREICCLPVKSSISRSCAPMELGGQVLSLAGPLSVFLAYAITGFNLFAVINVMGEIAIRLPLPRAAPVYACDSVGCTRRCSQSIFIAIRTAVSKAPTSHQSRRELMSAWSAGNSLFYSSTRVLYATALDGKAPRFLTFEKFAFHMPTSLSPPHFLIYLNVGSSSLKSFSGSVAVSTLIV